MILTCPECATSYFVDDARIPLTGRKVKCANCGARWLATLDPPPTDLDPEEVSPELAAVISPEVVAEPPLEPEATAEAVESAFGDIDVLEAAAVPAEPDTGLRPRRAIPAARPPVKTAPSLQLILLVILAALAVMAAALVVLRAQVMAAVPATTPAYKALGLVAGPADLSIEGVRSQAAFQGERPVLSVTGALKNAGQETVAVPPLRVRLLDRAGKVLATRTVAPTPDTAPAGATRYFAVIVPDPPASTVSLDVEFAPVKAGEATKAKADAGHAPAKAETKSEHDE